jgi:hypothetical protein
MSRETSIYMARVFLAQARARRHNPAQRGFCFVLLEWAANRRKEAAAIRREPLQGVLFDRME